MEQKPKKFPREVYRSSKIEGGWEDCDPNIQTEAFSIIEEDLENLGIDLTKVKVLEIGSGNARLVDYLRKKGVDIVGVDARPRGSKESSQISARIEALPFRDETFEVVLSAGNVFDLYVYDQDHKLMMQEIARVLKHGGYYLGLAEEIDTTYEHIDGFDLVPNSESKTVYKKS